jgi:hypothetical protein
MAFAHLFGASDDDVVTNNNNSSASARSLWDGPAAAAACGIAAEDLPKLAAAREAINAHLGAPASADADRATFVAAAVFALAFGPAPESDLLPRPCPLDLATLLAEAAADPVGPGTRRDPREVWPVHAAAVSLIDAFRRLAARMALGTTDAAMQVSWGSPEAQFSPPRRAPGAAAAVVVEFDKDARDAMRCVHALASLRCAVFRVRGVSLHDARGVAGGIVASLCTTNALIAAAMVRDWLAVSSAIEPAAVACACPQRDQVPRAGEPAASTAASRCAICGPEAELLRVVAWFFFFKYNSGLDDSHNSHN